jgi:DnaJ family protein C protein 7
MKHLQQAVRSDPDNTTVRAYYRKIKEIDERKNAGDECFKTGDHQGAIDAYSQCITLTKTNRPFSSKLHLNRGICHLRLKQYDSAVKDFNNAIYYNDKYIKAYVRRAEAYIGKNTPEDIERGIRWVGWVWAAY